MNEFNRTDSVNILLCNCNSNLPLDIKWYLTSSSEQNDDPHMNEKQSINTRLLDAVKQCQVRFGGRSELATDSDSRVSCLCAAWEAALQHGMRHGSKAFSALKQVTEITGLSKVAGVFSEAKSAETEPVFWQYIKEHLTKHEQERFNDLKAVDTDSGKGRAWLRASLNENSLERYMHMAIEEDEILKQYYDDWAFLRDHERRSMLPTMAAGLGSILFAINVDNPELNTIHNTQVPVIALPKSRPQDSSLQEEPKPVIAEEVITEKKKDKKKKKKIAQIVSFDNEEDDSSVLGHRRFSARQSSIDSIGRMKINAIDSSKENSDGMGNVSETGSKDSGVFLSQTDYGNVMPIVKSENLLTNKLARNPSTQSISSHTSLDQPSSNGSFSSADFDLSDINSVMTPVVPSGDGPDTIMVPLSRTSSLRTRSGGSTDLNYFGDDIKSAAAALAMAQKGYVINHSGGRTDGDGSNIEEKVKENVMSTDELKQAVIAMMLRKEEIEEQNRTLQSVLEQEMSQSSTLRAEIEEIKVNTATRQEKDQTKIQSLQKENELLRHQLRKYVSAVQMLRTDGSQVDPNLSNLGIKFDEPQPNIPPEKEIIDYSHEASEYEQKLIQVAEMHGELLEFNEMLHKQISAKDHIMRRLQAELIDLRGPFPHDSDFRDDSLGKDFESLSFQMTTLINIWIPSAFLQGSGTDVHHVYQVYVRIKDEEWNIYRRFSQFHELHTKLKKVYPETGKFEFPPKKTLGKKDEKLVESRRKILQTYLRNVINHILSKNEDLSRNVCKERLLSSLPFFSDKQIDRRSKKKKKAVNVPVDPHQTAGQSQENRPPSGQYTGL